MNEELTNEILEAMAKCSETFCSKCLAGDVCCSNDTIPIEERLATALLAEMDKPRVWDGAPDRAKVALVGWYENNEQKQSLCRKCYTRELPKSRARQIAEELTGKIANRDATYEKSVFYFDGEPLVDVIEAVLNKYAEELKGEA